MRTAARTHSSPPLPPSLPFSLVEPLPRKKQQRKEGLKLARAIACVLVRHLTPTHSLTHASSCPSRCAASEPRRRLLFRLPVVHASAAKFLLGSSLRFVSLYLQRPSSPPPFLRGFSDSLHRLPASASSRSPAYLAAPGATRVSSTSTSPPLSPCLQLPPLSTATLPLLVFLRVCVCGRVCVSLLCRRAPFFCVFSSPTPHPSPPLPVSTRASARGPLFLSSYLFLRVFLFPPDVRRRARRPVTVRPCVRVCVCEVVYCQLLLLLPSRLLLLLFLGRASLRQTPRLPRLSLPPSSLPYTAFSAPPSLTCHSSDAIRRWHPVVRLLLSFHVCAILPPLPPSPTTSRALALALSVYPPFL